MNTQQQQQPSWGPHPNMQPPARAVAGAYGPPQQYSSTYKSISLPKPPRSIQNDSKRSVSKSMDLIVKAQFDLKFKKFKFKGSFDTKSDVDVTKLYPKDVILSKIKEIFHITDEGQSVGEESESRNLATLDDHLIISPTEANIIVYSFQYKDEEGDWISFDSKVEWEDFLRYTVFADHTHKRLPKMAAIKQDYEVAHLRMVRGEGPKGEEAEENDAPEETSEVVRSNRGQENWSSPSSSTAAPSGTLDGPLARPIPMEYDQVPYSMPAPLDASSKQDTLPYGNPLQPLPSVQSIPVHPMLFPQESASPPVSIPSTMNYNAPPAPNYWSSPSPPVVQQPSMPQPAQLQPHEYYSSYTEPVRQSMPPAMGVSYGPPVANPPVSSVVPHTGLNRDDISAEAHLKTLSEMGFNDRAHNLVVLSKYESMEAVINDLMSH